MYYIGAHKNKIILEIIIVAHLPILYTSDQLVGFSVTLISTNFTYITSQLFVP